METIFLDHSNSKPQITNTHSCVLALGFFDGVHLGHQRLIQTAKKIAEEKQVSLAVMTFYPHPRQIVNKNTAPVKYLTPLYRKQEILKNMGVEKLFIVKFDPNFAKLSPEEFVQQYIINLGCVHVVGGFDYNYGYKGQGNMKTLLESGEGHFGVTVVKKISFNKEKISSTLIRGLIAEGKMQFLPKYLGSFYKVSGMISRSWLLKDGLQELVVKIEADSLLPADGQYQIQLTCNNLFYHGTIQKISDRDNYSLLYVYIYEDYNLSIGDFVNIKWIKSLEDLYYEEIEIEMENVM